MPVQVGLTIFLDGLPESLLRFVLLVVNMLYLIIPSRNFEVGVGKGHAVVSHVQ